MFHYSTSDLCICSTEEQTVFAPGVGFVGCLQKQRTVALNCLGRMISVSISIPKRVHFRSLIGTQRQLAYHISCNFKRACWPKWKLNANANSEPMVGMDWKIKTKCRVHQKNTRFYIVHYCFTVKA